MKVEHFGFRQGMKQQEIFDEIKNKVSGETRQELQFFREGVMEHQVVIENGEYAILLTYELSYPLKVKLYDEQVVKKIFWVAGINDEQKYFIHRLEGIPEQLTRHIESTLEWVNRVDEGYTQRIQGDLLLRFTPRSYLDIENGLAVGKVLNMRGKETLMNRWSKHNEYGKWWFASLQEFSDDTWDLNERANVEGAFSEINLGNHFITTDRHMIVVNDEYLVIGGVFDQPAQINIQHSEHSFKSIQIPNRHVAIITGQRGRGLQTSNGVKLSISQRAGFD